MKGYFSQLAEHTGLVPGPGRSPLAGTHLSPALAASGARSRPLHVEEISFTSSPQEAAPTQDTAPTQDVAPTAAPTQDVVPTIAGFPEAETQVMAQDEPAEAVRFEPSREMTVSAPESNDAESGPVSPVETAARAPLHRAPLPIETVEVTPPMAMEFSPGASETLSLTSSETLSPTSEVSSEASTSVTPEAKTPPRRGLLNEEESSAGDEPAAEDWREASALPVQKSVQESVQEEDTQAVSPEWSETVEIRAGRLSVQDAPRGKSAPLDLKQPAHPTQGEEEALSRPVVRFEEQTGVAPRGSASREETFQNYLREIVEWVSAPPVIEAEAESWEQNVSRAQAQRTENRSEDRTETRTENTFVVRHDSDAPFPARQMSAEEGPEVQDLNLSIGTISVVIEEQKQQAAALPPAPPRAESPPARTGTERTSLSRYYLRSL